MAISRPGNLPYIYLSLTDAEAMTLIMGPRRDIFQPQWPVGLCLSNATRNRFLPMGYDPCVRSTSSTGGGKPVPNGSSRSRSGEHDLYSAESVTTIWRTELCTYSLSLAFQTMYSAPAICSVHRITYMSLSNCLDAVIAPTSPWKPPGWIGTRQAPYSSHAALQYAR